MKLLRQNTATSIHVGPLIASSGGALYTTATLAAGLLELYQAGATVAIDISTRTWAHISNGVYRLDLLAGDLSVAGPLEIHAHPASVVPLMVFGNVLAPTAYDALCAGSLLPVNTSAIAANTSAAGLLAAGASGIVEVTVGTGSTTTLVSTNLSSAVNGLYGGTTLVFLTGALAGQRASVTAYNGATKQLTTTALSQAPSSGDTAILV